MNSTNSPSLSSSSNAVINPNLTMKPKKRSSSFRLTFSVRKFDKEERNLSSKEEKEREVKEEQDNDRKLSEKRDEKLVSSSGALESKDTDPDEWNINYEFGFHRVLDQDSTGVLPHFASKLDNTPSLLNGQEVLLSLQMIYLGKTSAKLVQAKYSDLGSGVLELAQEHGKIQVPRPNNSDGRRLANNYSGWALGKIEEVGQFMEGKLSGAKLGDRVIPMCSLSTLPTKIDSIDGVNDGFVSVRGHGIVFSNASFITVPSDIDSEFALLAVDIASSLSQVPLPLNKTKQTKTKTTYFFTNALAVTPKKKRNFKKIYGVHQPELNLFSLLFFRLFNILYLRWSGVVKARSI